MKDRTTVPRETSARLEKYQALLLKWNSRINLIGKSTESIIVSRHIEESTSLLTIACKDGEWLDLGSGGGLPGIPISIVGEGAVTMTLIESDARKCEFLRAVRRELGLEYRIICDRIEDCVPIHPDVVVSRALAPLVTLLGYASFHGSTETICVFPKGQSWKSEIIEAQATWSFNLDVVPSEADLEAAILRIQNVRPV